VGYYAYSQLPLTISNFPAYGATPETVYINDVQNPNCVASKSFTSLSCSSQLPCEITSMSATASDCDANNMFTVTINMSYTEPGSAFILSGNGVNYGTFAYTALPVVIGPFPGDGVTFYEFLAQDIDNPNCANEANLGIVDCTNAPCEIGQLVVDPTVCTSSTTYAAVIDFEVVNPSSSTFIVTDMNNNNLGVYAYSSLPITVELQSMDNPHGLRYRKSKLLCIVNV
jgi:hypothetical protein